MTTSSLRRRTRMRACLVALLALAVIFGACTSTTEEPDATSPEPTSAALPEAWLPDSFPEPGPEGVTDIPTDVAVIADRSPRRQCGVQYTDKEPLVRETSGAIPPYADIFVECFTWARDNNTTVEAVTLHENEDGTSSVLISIYSNPSDAGIRYNPEYTVDPDDWYETSAANYIGDAPYGGIQGLIPLETDRREVPPNAES